MRGLWFDRFELDKVDEPHESAGQALLEMQRDPDLHVDREARRLCPRCQDVVMMRHFFSHRKQVEVDECPACGGFWLDAGELAAIRDQFDSDEERQKAAEEYFQEVFGGQLEKMQAESREKLEKARKIARMFRFICPTYYIPGKQRWGAF